MTNFLTDLSNNTISHLTKDYLKKDIKKLGSEILKMTIAGSVLGYISLCQDSNACLSDAISCTLLAGTYSLAIPVAQKTIEKLPGKNSLSLNQKKFLKIPIACIFSVLVINGLGLFKDTLNPIDSIMIATTSAFSVSVVEISYNAANKKIFQCFEKIKKSDFVKEKRWEKYRFYVYSTKMKNLIKTRYQSAFRFALEQGRKCKYSKHMPKLAFM